MTFFNRRLIGYNGTGSRESLSSCYVKAAQQICKMLFRKSLIFALCVLCLAACSGSKPQPSQFALIPASTGHILVFSDPKTLDDPAVLSSKMFNIPQVRSVLSNAGGLNFASVNNPMLVGAFIGESMTLACIFHHQNPSAIIASVKGRADAFLGHEIREVANPAGEPIWWGKINGDTIAFGSKLAVAEIISISEQKAQSIFQAREDLQPLLSAYANSSDAFFFFKPSDDAKLSSAAAEVISRTLMNGPQGQLFRMAAGSRGLVFSRTSGQNNCEQDIGIQFNGRSAAILSSGILSILPYGPDEIQPKETDADRDGSLTRLHLRYAKSDCGRVGLGFERLKSSKASGSK